MRTAAAWSFPCGGCFFPAGREAPGRSCSHPPAYVSLTFVQKKTASVSLHQRFFSWARVDYASRAAKNSLAGCFCPAGRKAPGRSCSNPPAIMSLMFMQKKTASVSLH